MKKIILLFCVLAILSNCSERLDENEPGTLGEAASIELNCHESNVELAMDRILEDDNFKTLIQDSLIINWWVKGGYDFLNYRCINIQHAYYMISIYSENFDRTYIAIRAIYSRKRKDWIYARKFTEIQKYNAKKAMEYLLVEMGGC
jgi:hypothetical protein